MGEGEQEALLEIEAGARAFIEYFDRHVQAAVERGSTLHPFAPGTVTAAELMRSSLQRLDELRSAEPRTNDG